MQVTSKQDRGGVRTAQELEQKYDLAAIAGLKVAQKNSENDLTKIDAEMQQFIKATLVSFEDMQKQIDGSITTWFYSGVPDVETIPSSEWTTDELKNEHLGDLYYDQNTGYAYRFAVTDGVYGWLKITDNDVVEALALANAANDAADSKRRVFTEQPVPPYDRGDLWVFDGELYMCDIAKTAGELYQKNDFIIATKYTDDSRVEELEGLLADNYYTMKEVDSALEKTDESIKAHVKETYITKSVAEDILEKVETTESIVTQTAEKIDMVVKSGGSQSNLELTDEAIKAMTEKFVIKSASGETIIKGGSMKIEDLAALNATIGGWDISEKEITKTARAWIYPTYDNMVYANLISIGEVTPTEAEIKAYDLNTDGAVNVRDMIAINRFLIGTATIDWYPDYEQIMSDVTIDISPDNADKTVHIYGKNSFGSEVESYIGINGVKAPKMESDSGIFELLRVTGNGTGITPFTVDGEASFGAVKTTSGANLDDIKESLGYKTQYVGFSYGGQGLGLTFHKSGRVCTAYINNNVATGVANSTVTLASGIIPAKFRPVCNVKQLLEYNANGTRYSCQLGFTTDGNVTALANAAGALSLTGYTITYITAS